MVCRYLQTKERTQQGEGLVSIMLREMKQKDKHRKSSGTCVLNTPFLWVIHLFLRIAAV